MVLAIVIGVGGLSIWLAIVRGRAYLAPAVLVLMFLVEVWGWGILLTLLACIGLSLLPAKPGSRWELHKARVASGDSDPQFFSPPMIIFGTAAFTLLIGVVLVLVN